MVKKYIQRHKAVFHVIYINWNKVNELSVNNLVERVGLKELC